MRLLENGLLCKLRKTTQAWLGGKSLFFSYNLSNFLRPMQSLLLRNTPKIYRLPNFNNYALSLPANRIFQKRTVFVFTESSSRDQLLQKAYCVPAANTSVHVQGKRKYVPWSTTSWTLFSRLSCEQSNRRWALDAWNFHFNLGWSNFKNFMQNAFSLSEKGSEKHFTSKNATVFKCIYSE